MIEEWKDIKDWEGLYRVSSLGRIYSIRRNLYLKPRLAGNYYRVALTKNSKQYQLLISRLVAQAFIPNPNNLPCVNHKDENKLNNTVDNLEWCDYKYNTNYGSRNKRVSEKLKGKPLSELTKSRLRHPKGMNWKQYEELMKGENYVG